MRRIVVSGANRGIGLEFCRQLLANGDAVIAIARQVPLAPSLEELKRLWPDTFHISTFDVTDHASVREFGEQVAALPVHILINNAGQIGPETHKGEDGQNLATLDPQLLSRLFEVNAIAPLVLTRALLPSLRLTGNAKVFVLGSTVGVAKQTFGDYYGYRMSKAAAHIAFATLAKDLAEQRIMAATICPGWVKTDLGGPNASLEIDDSVRQMIAVINSFSPEQNGLFLDQAGNVLDY
jgi:NAD(P)-dependent dehydrogenase (short-subunit alcohol dehydrogenase family)